jgi:hypothetical protein
VNARWNEITREHVLQAIWKCDNSNTEGYARNTFLRHEGKLYPAKHIRALAYEVAFGRPADRSTFSGGKETVLFFENLRFEAVYRPASGVVPNQKAREKPDAVTQEGVLQPHPNEHVNGDMVSGKTFDWRSFEIDIQRIRLVYLKWLCYYNPKPGHAVEACKYQDDVYVIASPYGRSFSLSPAGKGQVYVGAGRGTVRIPGDSYASNPDLLAETECIRKSLDTRVKRLKREIERLVLGEDYELAWEYMQNYWWIRLGMHEYVFDAQFGTAKIPRDDVRHFILASIYNKIDLSNDVPRHFTDSQILDSLRRRFAWDRFGCCSYDCGPIALGKGGFVPYKIAAAHARHYRAENNDALRSAATLDGKRDFAAQSLQHLYDFPILYHRLGFYTLADFENHKRHYRRG